MWDENLSINKINDKYSSTFYVKKVSSRLHCKESQSVRNLSKVVESDRM
jgi:hypothetical protein